jgi:serine/threonine protein kinase
MATDLAAGSSFGGYRVERLIARGGMGAVYLAAETRTQRPVALKLVRADYAEDPLFRARFERESRLMAELDHAHVVPLYEAGDIDGVLFSATRFIDGVDLEALIAHHRALHPRWAAEVAGQVASALDAAHEAGLIHRDVKPANILIEDRDGEAHAYLADFGLSKHVSSQSGLTGTGMWVGTIDYAAPEQIQAQDVTPRTDVYALGCVLYEMLTGEVPYPRARDVDKMMAHAADPPPTVTDAVPPGFNDVVERALSKLPEDRYASAGALARAARAVAKDARSAPRQPLVPPATDGGSTSIDRGAPTAG